MVQYPRVGSLAALGVDFVYELVDVMAVEYQTLRFKMAADAFTAYHGVLHEQTSNALAVIVFGFGAQGGHGRMRGFALIVPRRPKNTRHEDHMRMRLTLPLMFIVTFAVRTTAWIARSYWKLKQPDTSPQERREIRKRLKDALNAAFVSIAFVGSLAVALWLSKYGDQILRYLVHFLGLKTVQFLVAITVLLLGGIAYGFKRFRQHTYGTGEIIFGVVASIVALDNLAVTNFFPTLITLAGCVYVVARGVSNVWEGLQKLPKRPNR